MQSRLAGNSILSFRRLKQEYRETSLDYVLCSEVRLLKKERKKKKKQKRKGKPKTVVVESGNAIELVMNVL